MLSIYVLMLLILIKSKKVIGQLVAGDNAALHELIMVEDYGANI